MKHLICLALLCMWHTITFCPTITNEPPAPTGRPQQSSSQRVNDMRVPITYTTTELQSVLSQLEREDKRICKCNSEEQIYHHAQMRKQELWPYIEPYQKKLNEAIEKTYNLYTQAQTAHPDERDLCYKKIQKLAALIEECKQAITDICNYKAPTEQDMYGWLGSYLFGPRETLYTVKECEPTQVTFIKEEIYNSSTPKKTITGSICHDHNSVNIPWQKPKTTTPPPVQLNPHTTSQQLSESSTPQLQSQANNQTPPPQPPSQTSSPAPTSETSAQTEISKINITTHKPELSTSSSRLQELLQPYTPSKDVIQLTPLTKLENKPQVNLAPSQSPHFSFHQKPPTARLFSFDLGNHTTAKTCPPIQQTLAKPTPLAITPSIKPTQITFTNEALKGVTIAPMQNVPLHKSPLASIPLLPKPQLSIPQRSLSFIQDHPIATSFIIQSLNAWKNHAAHRRRIEEANLYNKALNNLITAVNTYAQSPQPPQNCEKPIIQSEQPPFYYFRQESRTAYTQEQKLRNEITNYTLEHKDILAQRAHELSICALMEYKSQGESDKFFMYAQRVKGIHDTLMHPGYISSNYHTLFDTTREMLNRHTINADEFTNYTGNPLQQALHSELVDTLNVLGKVEKVYGAKAHQTLIFTDAAIEFTHAAKKYNDAGNFDLTNNAAHIGQQCLHLAQVYGKAAAEGVFEGVANTTHALLHPLQTAQECLHMMRTIAVEVGCMIQRIAPPAPWTIYNNPQAWQTYKTALSDEITWWNDTALALYQTYQDAPQGTAVKYAIRMGIETIANKKIFKAFTALGARAKKEITSNKLFKSLTSPDKLKTAPAATLATEAHCVQELVSYAQTKNIPAQQVLEGIKNLETRGYNNPLAKLNEAHQHLKGIPGAEENIYKVLDNAYKTNSLGTASGALYELEVATTLKKQGVKILEINQKIDVRDFDIVTPTKVIECKNIMWSHFSEKVLTEKINKYIGQFQANLENANKVGKTLEIHSNWALPAPLKQWLQENNISFVEYIKDIS